MGATFNNDLPGWKITEYQGKELPEKRIEKNYKSLKVKNINNHLVTVAL